VLRTHRSTFLYCFLVCVVPPLASSACNSTTTSANGGIAQVGVAVSPTTITSQSSTNANYQYEADFTLNLTETGGVAATVTSISSDVAEVVGGIAVSTGNVVQEIQVNSTSNRLNANGTLSIPVQVFYTLPEGGSQAQVTIALAIVDDNGDSVGGNLSVDIQ
jgi:hypothetical protein